MILMTGITMSIVLSMGDLGVGSLVAFLPVIFGLIVLIINNPFYGLLFYINYSFFFTGLNRYIVGAPLGLSIDGVLFLTTLSMIFRLNKNNVKALNNGVLYTTLLWFVYTFLEIVNPEANKIGSWVYAVRGISLYAIQTVPLTLLLFTKKEDLNTFFRIIMGWGLFTAFWGWKQINIGVDAYERGWLDREGKSTHILGDQLRAFSLYSDAGQFGVTMAYIAFIFLVLALGPYSRRLKIWYALGFFICIIGMGTSGSRGPVFVIFVGLISYLLLVKNYKILLPGILSIALVFSILKFSYIGNANYQIYRVRTALDPNEASLLVRLENQAKLRKYLESRPFGSGIGTTDVWAQRFYPGSFLANLPTDSWFVKIWAENGVVGLSIYAFSLAFVIVMGVVNIRKLKNPDTRQKMIALYGGFLGILVASFGNPVFGQAPLGSLMYISMTILATATIFDYDIDKKSGLLKRS
jgi:hypothetical protein